MINRQKLNKVLNVIERLNNPSEATVTARGDGKIEVAVWPMNWWSDRKYWSADERHKNLAVLTTLVGKLEIIVDDGKISYKGERDEITIGLYYVGKCKILGYKNIVEMVEREIERKELKYETVEKTRQIPITDCDIRMGKFKMEDIEVKA